MGGVPLIGCGNCPPPFPSKQFWLHFRRHTHTGVHTLAGRLIQDPALVLLPPFSAKKKKKREEGVRAAWRGRMGGERQEKGEGTAAVRGPGIKGRAET